MRSPMRYGRWCMPGFSAGSATAFWSSSVEAEAIDARLEITVAYRLAGGDEATTIVTVSSPP